MALNILIVEDDFFIAEDLSDIVRSHFQNKIVFADNCQDAISKIDDGLAFAFLDMTVADGTIVPVARHLSAKAIPFAFVSGSPQSSLPDDLKSAPFIQKPARQSELIRVANLLEAANQQRIN